MPALLVADAAKVQLCDPPLMTVAADAITRFRRTAIESLAVAAEADVPINGGVSARFGIFRDAIGGSSGAVFVGGPRLGGAGPASVPSARRDRGLVRAPAPDCGRH